VQRARACGAGLVFLDLGGIPLGLFLFGALSLGLAHYVGLALVRGEHHQHVASILLGCRLDKAEFLNILRKFRQETKAEFRSTLLTSAEHDRDLDLVPRLQEALHVTFLGFVVVWIDLGTKLHLLDDGVRLVPPGFAFLERCLVLELAEVHELAHRRLGHRCDLDEVKVGLNCEPQCILNADDAYLLTVWSDQAYLGYANPVVDPGFDADGASLRAVSNCRSGCFSRLPWREDDETSAAAQAEVRLRQPRGPPPGPERSRDRQVGVETPLAPSQVTPERVEVQG